MATFQSITKNRSISTSKSTSTPISIVEFPIPEHEDLDTHHTSQSLSSITEPSTSSIHHFELHGNDSPSLNTISPRKSAKKSPKKTNKYYKNLTNTSKARPNIEIHAKRRYKLDDGRCGTCQFIGQTSFAKGVWVGMVLDNFNSSSTLSSGNTNGTIYGKKYFQCRAGKGLFVRPSKIVQALGSIYKSTYSAYTRTRAKSANKKTKIKASKTTNLSTTHNKSISSDAAPTVSALSMSTSSPLHFNREEPKFSALNGTNPSNRRTKKKKQIPIPKSKKSKSYNVESIESKQRKKHLAQPINKDDVEVTQVQFTKSKSMHVEVARMRSTNKNDTIFDDDDATPTPEPATHFAYNDPYADIMPPITPAFDGTISKSADNSPYLTPVSPGLLANANRLMGLSLGALTPEDSPGSSDGGVVLDTFSALRAYFDDHEDALSDEGGYTLRDRLWESSEDDSSEGARSDSMLDDEDWVNRQHRAREASLAETLADAWTIPALHSVQKKVGLYIGSTEKWKPPNYDVTPDHGSVLQEKLLHHKKHLDENWKNKKRTRKLGPIEIGTAKGFKLPKYDTVCTPEGKRKLSFLDQDKGWYHKPSQVTSNKKQLMTPTVGRSNKKLVSKEEIEKRSKTPKRHMATWTNTSINESEETDHNEMKMMTPPTVSSVMNGLKKSEHQRSHSELPKKVKKKKKKKKLKKTKTEDNEWFESERTWLQRKKRKLGPRDVGRSSYKGTKLKSDKSGRNSKKRKNKKKKFKHARNKPQTISLPTVPRQKPNPKLNKDKPQSAKSACSTSSNRSTPESIPSPFPSQRSKDTKKNVNIINIINKNRTDKPMEEFLAMSIVEDEEDNNMALVPDIPYKMGLNGDMNSAQAGSSVGALFRTGDVIFEDSETLANADARVNKPKKKKKKKTKAKKKAPRNERSVSLFSGSSNQIQKEKRSKSAKKKVKEMNSAKSMVQNVRDTRKTRDSAKKKKNTKNGKKKGKANKKKNKIFDKPGARHPTYG